MQKCFVQPDIIVSHPSFPSLGCTHRPAHWHPQRNQLRGVAPLEGAIEACQQAAEFCVCLYLWKELR